MQVKSQDGFSYIEVIIAIVILMVGILALLSAITGAVVQASGQQQQLAAKQIATSTIESIMSAKETDVNRVPALVRLGWEAVGNVGSNIDPITGLPQGVFVTGIQSVMTDAGPDQIIGTADDTGTIVPNAQRQIVITDICDPERPSANCVPVPANPLPVRIRTVQVTITYFVGTIQRQEVLTTVLTNYSVAN
ncbi:MAG: type IV pilus modification PilV family protein [Pyrinomonadaceae bacterium]